MSDPRFKPCECKDCKCKQRIVVGGNWDPVCAMCLDERHTDRQYDFWGIRYS